MSRPVLQRMASEFQCVFAQPEYYIFFTLHIEYAQYITIKLNPEPQRSKLVS